MLPAKQSESPLRVKSGPDRPESRLPIFPPLTTDVTRHNGHFQKGPMRKSRPPRPSTAIFHYPRRSPASMPSSTCHPRVGENEDLTRKEARRRERKPLSEPDYTLLATVKSVTVSYFVGTHGDGVSDEAITDVLCHIVAVTPSMPKHLGKEVTCSLMCSREYGRVDDPDEKGWPRIGKGQTVPERPFLLNMRLTKDGGSFSAYLPEAAYWPLQTDLKSGRLKFIEARFIKPRHGDGRLTSINFSETAPEET